MSENDREIKWTLSAADAAAADALLERSANSQGHEADKAHDSARRERVAAWLKVLAAGTVPAAGENLAERTMARVDQDRLKLPQNENTRGVSNGEIDRQVRRRWSRRLANIAAMAVAAAILVVLTIMGVGTAKQSHLRTLCANNLKGLGTAFGVYATANLNQLPSLMTPANDNWLANTGDGPASNGSNLAPLLTGKYIPGLANLFCAAVLPETPLPATTPNNLGEIGYSYTHLYGPSRPFWDGRSATIVLTDRNPMFGPGSTPLAQRNPDANSPNHGGHGNYILAADASVKWETSPNIGPGGDNIWTVSRGTGRLVNYVGNEMPSGAGDVFMCP